MRSWCRGRSFTPLYVSWLQIQTSHTHKVKPQIEETFIAVQPPSEVEALGENLSDTLTTIATAYTAPSSEDAGEAAEASLLTSLDDILSDDVWRTVPGKSQGCHCQRVHPHEGLCAVAERWWQSQRKLRHR